MEKFKKRNKILVVISSLILIILALLISKATYSFLEPVDPDDVIINSEITATGDTLLFTKGTDINVTLTQDNFNSESCNLVRSVTPQVKLIASNKTNNAEATYYVSVNISENTFQYTNGTSNPEILLTVTDNEGNPLTTCTGLTYTTVGGVSGFDITDKLGVYDFAEQTISTTSSTSGTTHNWTYTVTFINKETDQSINEDAKISIGAILHKEPETFCQLNPDVTGCNLSLSYNPAISRNIITLENGYIYYHDENLTNGAGDYSYRYAGANPNNYICFGSEAATCPAENIYRIIGLIPVDVVIDDTNPNNIITQRQMLYKIIKNDYLTSTEASTGTGTYNSSWHPSTFSGPSGNQYVSNPQGYYWSGSSSNTSNTWSSSTLNTYGLNNEFINTFESGWQNKMANAIWKVGGRDDSDIRIVSPMSVVYNNEINYSGTNLTNVPTDGKNEYATKVGLMYVSDYGYAASSITWDKKLDSYYDSSVTANNWLYRGIDEWVLSRNASTTNESYFVDYPGHIRYFEVEHYAFGVRPTFYLTEDIEIDMINHAGTLADPYRITNIESYVYWNDNFSNTIYTSTQVPTGTGLNGTYQTREQLATAYTDWEDAPIYIKTTKVNGTVTGHTACLWYNNREFCMDPNYWTGTIGVEDATEGSNTKVKLKADMENALGITIADSSCGSLESLAYCGVGDFNCSAHSGGEVSCYSLVAFEGCTVFDSGNASCSG